jgi:hypothetical protein
MGREFFGPAGTLIAVNLFKGDVVGLVISHSPEAIGRWQRVGLDF